MSESEGPVHDAAAFEFAALRVGQVVGRYRIASILGQGGFGITYRAVDAELGREVAIKEYLPAALAIRQDGTTVLPRSTAAAGDFAWGRDRFVAEGRTLAALHRTPGIVLVHDFLETNGTAYLVMELLHGETLQQRVARSGPLDASRIDRILGVLLSGLDAVHAAGFLHRDIKPANILVDDQDRATLIDFGASRVAVSERSQAMTAVFTPGYAPVEQFAAAPQGPWTDIYGLAATMHYAITGRPPPSAIDRMLDDAYVPLAGSDRPYPPQLLAGIDIGLAVRASERPQSIAAWREALARSTAAETVVMRRVPSADPGTGDPRTGDARTVDPRTVDARTGDGATGDTRTGEPAGTGTRKRLAILSAAAIAAVLALGGGWYVLAPAIPAASQSASPSSLSAPPTAASELEQAKREQKAALEEAARLRAEADARRVADDARRLADDARRQADEAATRRKIDDEARQKADADEAARRQAAAEQQRRADAAAAAQRQSDIEAKSQAEALARLKAEEADLKGAMAAEDVLGLTQSDRQRLQLALAALGFPMAGSDGVFGPRSREMIAAWQKKSGLAATGYLSAATQAALLRDAGPAVARQEEEQRKLAAARPPPAVTPGPSSPGKAGGMCDGTFRSRWCRAAYQGFPPSCWNSTMTIRNGEISDGWQSTVDPSHRNVVTGRIDSNGGVDITYQGIGQQTHINQRFTAAMTGKVADGALKAAGHAGANGRDFTVQVQCR
jgi:serine/threonine protein kinase/peptidoglycan hydrolase-like protein with peptidoglycan-binding domain